MLFGHARGILFGEFVTNPYDVFVPVSPHCPALMCFSIDALCKSSAPFLDISPACETVRCLGVSSLCTSDVFDEVVLVERPFPGLFLCPRYHSRQLSPPAGFPFHWVHTDSAVTGKSPRLLRSELGELRWDSLISPFTLEEVNDSGAHFSYFRHLLLSSPSPLSFACFCQSTSPPLA